MPDIADVAWSERDDRNSEAVPEGWPQGTMPAYVDQTGRMMMGATKRFWNKINPVYQTSGTGDAYVVVTEVGVDQINLYELLTVRIDRANVGTTPTLQFGSTNPRTIVKAGLSGYVPLAAADMYPGNSHTFWYNGAFYILTDPAIIIGGTVQPFSPNLTSWAAVTRATGFDTWAASGLSADLAALVSDETGTGSLVFANTPILTTPFIGTATGTNLTLTGLTASSALATNGSKTIVSIANTGSGNNVLATSPTLVTPILGAAAGTSLSLSGLTASSAVATDASKNLVSVTNTGTGNNVLATSPTLVTPALGTPTAVVLTSGTGLPLTTGVTGTLGIGNGGTGQATKAAAYDALSPNTTWGDVEFRGTANNVRLAASTAGYHFQTNGAGADPSWAGFLQAGTSAVLRTWQNKARDRVDAADFGAVGDGSTNNSTAIQAAITSLGATGGTVNFGPGDFRIGTAITIPNNVWLKGAGRYATIITGTSATMDNLVISAAGNCGISDMGISTSITKTAGAAISIVSASQNIVLRNLGISTQLTGIKIDASGSIWLDEIEISAIKVTTGVGILINGTNDHYLRNVFCKSSAIGSQCAAGFRITATGATWMSGCGALWCNNGLELVPGAGQTVQHLFSTMNAYDTGTGYGILINAATGTTVNRCYFVQDWGATNTLDGFYALGTGTVNDINIIGHRAYQNGAFGIHFDAGVNVKIHDCTVAGNSATTINTTDGIAVNASNVSIKNNRVGNAAGFGAQQRYGILLNGTNTYVQVEGNDLTGNASGPINNGLTSTTSRIERNLGYNPVGAAAVTTSASPYTYTAGPSPETLYFSAATAVSAVTQGGVSILPVALAANAVFTAQLEPNEAIVITYTGTLTAKKMVH